jgi:hypothetical protein
MNKPFKYTIIDNNTGEFTETNIKPLLHQLQTWEPTDKPNVNKLVQTKTVYIDTRYEAKLRLYNYITFTKNGLNIPKYNPYKNSDIGNNIPILTF